MALMNYKLFACKQKFVDVHAKRYNTRGTGGLFFPIIDLFCRKFKTD